MDAGPRLNPRVSNLGDRGDRKFNYPMLWVTIGRALNLTDEARFIFSFVGVCAFLIYRFPSLGLLASQAAIWLNTPVTCWDSYGFPSLKACFATPF
jgi:hypothetical protein